MSPATPIGRTVHRLPDRRAVSVAERFPGSFDAFVTKINAAGNALVYSTYLGGNGSEFSIDGGAIAVDGDGNAYVGGLDGSANFPGASTSTIQPIYGGGVNDGFVVKFNAAGSALLYSTYLGGSGYDAVHGIAIDAARNAYRRRLYRFPTSRPAVVRCRRSQERIRRTTPSCPSSTPRAAPWSTARISAAAAPATSPTPSRSTAAATRMSAGSPTPATSRRPTPSRPSTADPGDAFVSELNAAGSALLFSTYLGGGTGHRARLRHRRWTAPAMSTSRARPIPPTFPPPAPLQATLRRIWRPTPSWPDSRRRTATLEPPTNFIATLDRRQHGDAHVAAPAGGIAAHRLRARRWHRTREVLASLPTNSTATTFTFSAPTGAFYIRMHSLAPGPQSVASNEIRIFVNVPAPPSAPANLLGFVNGSALGLAWTNTAGGGSADGDSFST